MDQVAAFLLGLTSATVGAIAAGGGLISIPGMIFLGLTPVSAIATTRLNIMSGGILAINQYRKAGVLVWKYIVPFLLISLVAGIVGPSLLLAIDPNIVKRLVGITLLIMLPALWYKKDAGTIKAVRSQRRKLVGFLVVLAVMFYATMFGGGAGIFLIYTFVYFFGMTVIEANSTGLILMMVATAAALITYISGGAVNWSLGIPAMMGAFIGGYVGAHLALKKGAVWVKAVLTLVIIISGVKLTFL
ncbi:MAG: sulfite exporter TauE/SafE family protein [Patescibacteria group bacterium]